MKRRNLYAGSATAACAAVALAATALAGGSSASPEPAAAPVVHTSPVAVLTPKPANKHRAVKARSAVVSKPAQAQPDTTPAAPQQDTTPDQPQAEAPGAPEPA